MNENTGLFPMRRWHKKEYNIFRLPDGKFEGRVFDKYRRVYCKTPPQDTLERAIKLTRYNCESYAKGQCVSGILVDEGKEIREREEKEYREIKKNLKKRRAANL